MALERITVARLVQYAMDDDERLVAVLAALLTIDGKIP